MRAPTIKVTRMLVNAENVARTLSFSNGQQPLHACAVHGWLEYRRHQPRCPTLVRNALALAVWGAGGAGEGGGGGGQRAGRASSLQRSAAAVLGGDESECWLRRGGGCLELPSGHTGCARQDKRREHNRQTVVMRQG
jgi:hypothetical protein